MSVLLVDTNVVSILFNRNHSLRQSCIDVVKGHELVVSFMTRAELSLWPVVNKWREARRGALEQHVALEDRTSSILDRLIGWSRGAVWAFCGNSTANFRIGRHPGAIRK